MTSDTLITIGAFVATHTATIAFLEGRRTEKLKSLADGLKAVQDWGFNMGRDILTLFDRVGKLEGKTDNNANAQRS